MTAPFRTSKVSCPECDGEVLEREENGDMIYRCLDCSAEFDEHDIDDEEDEELEAGDVSDFDDEDDDELEDDEDLEDDDLEWDV